MQYRHVVFGLAIMCMIALIVPLPQAIEPRAAAKAFRPCPYSPYQCSAKGPCKPLTIEGKVTRVYTETLADQMHPGMAITVASQDRGAGVGAFGTGLVSGAPGI